jgi:transcriptional regulator with XRE-family HTH domain
MEIFTVKDLSKLIKEKRLALGMTQSDASALCNVGIRFLSELENGKPTLQIDKVLKVAKFFDIKIFAE